MLDTVTNRLSNPDGTLKGTANSNPILDSRQYEVKFEDGTYSEYSANVLIENLYAHVDDHGHTQSLLKTIVGHRKLESAVEASEGYVCMINRSRKRRITTKGWDLRVEWTDGTNSWVSLADLKESNPIETAEYSTMARIDKEPAFAWWVRTVLKRRERIIKRVRHRLNKKNLKFGV